MRSERERGDEQRGHWGLKENAKRKKKKVFGKMMAAQVNFRLAGEKVLLTGLV